MYHYAIYECDIKGSTYRPKRIIQMLYDSNFANFWLSKKQHKSMLEMSGCCVDAPKGTVCVDEVRLTKLEKRNWE